ncbi:MAG: hypothetical protein WCI22_03145 [Actinomycetota bacterium]
MTENIIPDDQANGVVDGTLPASEVPASLVGVAEVLAAAHQPATSEELAGMTAIMSSFTAAVMSPVQESPEPVRSTSTMLTSRITKRAAVMACVGLLAAGTAAAGAGGAIPSPFHTAPRAHIEVAPVSSDGSTTTATDAGGTSTLHGVVPGVTEPEGSEPHGSEPDTSDGPRGSVPAGVPADGRHHGLCEAWTHGNHKRPNPAFSSLGDDAQHAGKTVDQFCADVLARWNHDHGTMPTTIVPPTTVTGSTVTPTESTQPHHPQGPPTSLPTPHGPPTSLPPPHGPPTSLPTPHGPPTSLPGQGGHGPGPSTTTTTTTKV